MKHKSKWDDDEEPSPKRNAQWVRQILQIPNSKIFDHTKYKPIQGLGAGSYGCAIKVQSLKNKAYYALKIINVSTKNVWETTHREISMGMLITHVQQGNLTGGLPFFNSVLEAQVYEGALPGAFRNMVKKKCTDLYDRWAVDNFNGPFVFMLIEYLPEGDVYDLLKSRDYNAETVRSFLFGLLWGFHGASQSLGFVHNDLSRGNVMIDVTEQDTYYAIVSRTDANVIEYAYKLPAESTIPKIIDLGFAFIYTNKTARKNVFVGSESAQPPEGLADYYKTGTEADRTIGGDVWAAGVLALTLITERSPPSASLSERERANVATLSREFVYDYPEGLDFGEDYHDRVGATLFTMYELLRLTQDPADEPFALPGNDQVIDALQEYTTRANVLVKDADLADDKNAVRKYVALATWVLNMDPNFWDHSATAPGEFYDLVKKMLAWDYRQRESPTDGLLALLRHPFFKPYQIAQSDIRGPSYRVSTAPSLYHQTLKERRIRLRQLQDSGYKLDKRCVVGCNVTPTHYCGCCIRLYCSEKCADTHHK